MLGGTPNRVQNGEVVQNAAESLPSPKKTFGERFGEFANTEFGKSSIAGLMGIGTAVSSYESVHVIQKGKHSA
jgi:hypothetical protein